jgi:predicted RNA-binding protein with PIN domain
VGKARKKVLLVDGYNVLRSGELYAGIRGEDHTSEAFNAARQTLLNDVATFAGRTWDATIVYDGGNNPASDGAVREAAGVHVIFSAAGFEADTVIEDLARRGAAAGAEVLVVTSDANTQWTVLGNNVTRMSAAGFSAEMRHMRHEVAEFNPTSYAKTTLAERLDPATRAALQRLLH